MKKNPNTVVKWVCAIFTVCLVILAVGGWRLFGGIITAANSIEKLEDGIYSLEYNGDYGFDEFLTWGGAASEVAKYLTSFCPAVFTRWKAMCRPESLAAQPSAHRMNTARFFRTQL